MKKTLFINEDDSHFTSLHPRENMCREGLEKLVDYYAEDTQVGGILFCVNYQKALYKSKVWEYICDDYDPKGPDDQPFLKDVDLSLGWHGRRMFDNMLALDKQNLDRYQIWLDRCRFHEVEGWLTIRMNDCHGLQEYRQRQEGLGDYQGWALFFPSQHWKAHPELMRAPYREERSMEGAYDYASKEVREHHFRLIEEVLERWDMDGIELDWLRWGMHFQPGQEQEGKAILTDFIIKVKTLIKKAENRVGHSIKLGVRIPSELLVCEALGYDPVAWTDQCPVDQIVLSSFGGKALYDIDIPLWRHLLGEKVRILGHCSDYLAPYTAMGLTGRIKNHEIYNGVASSLLNKGADGLYFFNTCYMEYFCPDKLRKLLQTTGSAQSLRKSPRRHILTFGDSAPGVPAREHLPIKLNNSAIGYDYNRLENSITLRLNIGYKPDQASKCTFYLGFSNKINCPESQVRCNSVIIDKISDIEESAIHCNELKECADNVHCSIPEMIAYDIDVNILHAGENVFELVRFSGNEELRWVEVHILPKSTY